MHAVVPYVVITIAILLFFRGEIPGPAGYAVHALAFFVCALACHLRLAASRPSPARLTEFYVWLSVGGALGGVFNVVVAPNVFHSVLEYPIALIAATALSRDAVPRWRWADFVMPIVLAIALVVAVTVAMNASSTPSRLTLGLILGAGSIAAFTARGRPLRFALSIGAILDGRRATRVGRRRDAVRRSKLLWRVSRGRRRRVGHAAILQRNDHSRLGASDRHDTRATHLLPSRRTTRRTVRRARLANNTVARGNHRARHRSHRVVRSAERDVDVLRDRSARRARGRGYHRSFAFLSSAQVRPRVVLGDARLSIEREPGERFDVLAIDAFSSDAIPVHLLTREALALYRSRLAADGVIAWHISNKYLDLRPVLEALAADAGLVALICDDAIVPSPSRGRFPSTGS